VVRTKSLAVRYHDAVLPSVQLSGIRRRSNHGALPLQKALRHPTGRGETRTTVPRCSSGRARLGPKKRTAASASASRSWSLRFRARENNGVALSPCRRVHDAANAVRRDGAS
jgi:hypothetical protein